MFYFVLAVGLLATLNLLLTLEILRRLRANAQSATGPEVMIAEGTSPAAFTASDTSGQRVEPSELHDCLVGFFAAGCPACADLKPGFLEEAARGRAVAVVVDVGHDDSTAALVAELESVARVIVEDHDGPVASAFGVRGIPVVCRTDSRGSVAVSHRHLAPTLRRVRTA